MSTPERPKPSSFYTTAELAARWQFDPKTLARWRREQVGPRFHKLGRRVVYTHQDIEAFELAQWQGPAVPSSTSTIQ